MAIRITTSYLHIRIRYIHLNFATCILLDAQNMFLDRFFFCKHLGMNCIQRKIILIGIASLQHKIVLSRFESLPIIVKHTGRIRAELHTRARCRPVRALRISFVIIYRRQFPSMGKSQRGVETIFIQPSFSPGKIIARIFPVQDTQIVLAQERRR